VFGWLGEKVDKKYITSVIFFVHKNIRNTKLKLVY
jgi:hypothetical protein